MIDNSVLFLGGDAAAIDGATVTGFTSTGIPYAQLTGEEASTILAFGMLGQRKPQKNFMSVPYTKMQGYALKDDPQTV